MKPGNGINAARQTAKVVSTVDVSGTVTAAPVLLPVGELAVRQAATVLPAGAFPWFSKRTAGRVLSAARRGTLDKRLSRTQID